LIYDTLKIFKNLYSSLQIYQNEYNKCLYTEFMVEEVEKTLSFPRSKLNIEK